MKIINNEKLSNTPRDEGLASTKSQVSQHELPLHQQKLSDAEILFGSNLPDDYHLLESARSAKSAKSHNEPSPFLPKEVQDLLTDEPLCQEELDQMVLRSGLELSKSSSKEGEYEYIRHLQYHSTSGKKSQKTSKHNSAVHTPTGHHEDTL